MSDFTELQLAMAKLDAALTGKSIEEVHQQLHHKVRSLREWYMECLWYLSDGGYSRVVLSVESLEDSKKVCIFLASESRDEVKARWDLCKPERAVVTAIVIRDYALWDKENEVEDFGSMIERKIDEGLTADGQDNDQQAAENQAISKGVGHGVKVSTLGIGSAPSGRTRKPSGLESGRETQTGCSRLQYAPRSSTPGRGKPPCRE